MSNQKIKKLLSRIAKLEDRISYCDRMSDDYLSLNTTDGYIMACYYSDCSTRARSQIQDLKIDIELIERGLSDEAES